MKKLISLAAIGFVAMFAIGADDDCSTDDSSKPAKQANGGSGGTDSSPTAEVKLNCDYLLGEGLNDYSFIAGGDVKNTGDVPVTVLVKAKWSRLGSDQVTASKTVKVPSGRTKEVQLSVPATMEDISAHQSAAAKCSANGTIVK